LKSFKVLKSSVCPLSNLVNHSLVFSSQRSYILLRKKRITFVTPNKIYFIFHFAVLSYDYIRQIEKQMMPFSYE
jgi:hypothetical protein